MKFIALIFNFSISPLLLAGVYEPDLIWPKKDINVCFMDNMEQLKLTEWKIGKEENKVQGFEPAFFDKSEAKFIKKIITDTYTAEDTGVNFIGWQGCSQSKDFDVILLKMDSFWNGALFPERPKIKGVANIGVGDHRNSPRGNTPNLKTDILPTVVLRDVKKFEMTQAFGQIAGLRHEHILPEAENDESCVIRVDINTWFNYRETTEELGDTAVINTSYDPMSIMNDCSINRRSEWFTVDSSLSEKDKETLKHMYP